MTRDRRFNRFDEEYFEDDEEQGEEETIDATPDDEAPITPTRKHNPYEPRRGLAIPKILNFDFALLLTNKWFVFWSIILSTSALVLIVSSLFQPKPQAQLDPASIKTLEAERAWQQAKYGLNEAIDRVDLNPRTLSDPGLRQQVIWTAAQNLRIRVNRLATGYYPDSPYIGMTEEAIYHVLKTEAINNLIVNGAEGRESTLGHSDRRNGAWVSRKLDGAETVAVGLLRLEVLEAAEHPDKTAYNLGGVATEIIRRYNNVRETASVYWRSKGHDLTADWLANVDAVGNKLMFAPKPALAPSAFPPPNNPSPSRPPAIGKQPAPPEADYPAPSPRQVSKPSAPRPRF